MTPNEQESELPMLAGIAGFIHWWEEFLNLVNGPVLLAGMFIALIDLLTDGKLTATKPVLLYVWAGSQALGIDGQLMGSWERVSRSRGWRLVGWLIVGVVLGFAAWQAGYVFAVQQSEGISEAAALAQLHMPTSAWLGWRMFLAVGLVALAGLTRYRRPAKIKPALADERADLERQLELEPLRQRLRATQVGGMRALAETALRGAGVAQGTQTANDAPAATQASQQPPTPAQEAQQAAAQASPDASPMPETPSVTPTDDRGGVASDSAPESPDDDPGGGLTGDAPARAAAAMPPAPTPIFTPRASRRPKPAAIRARDRAAAEALEQQRRAHAYAMLDADPATTANAIARQLRCRHATAKRYIAAYQRRQASKGA